ncbi:hypothetical protein F4781DRAFT_429586 [Annulohypoxylon bovei var. microspora]|nr:hypothetical protein F4781DRAFT_429586 [Annulohypoxylon bovei var. microspora]
MGADSFFLPSPDFCSRNCRHHWLHIYRPCWPGQGFDTCPEFGDGVAREQPQLVFVAGLCPACLMPGCYDTHQVRMIMQVKQRWRWGAGPSKSDPGCECAVM